MENDEKKENAQVARLEERTRALEKCDRRHYVMEVILLIAFLALTLLFVASCDIRTPEKKTEEKKWVYTEVTHIEDLSLSINEDGSTVTATAFGRDYKIEENDTTDIVPLSLTLRLDKAENRVDVIRDGDKAVIGYFEFR